MNTPWRNIFSLPLALCLGAALLFPAPTLAKDKGMLRIVTEPGDAQILINGKMKGNSPAEAGQSFAIKLDEGEYQVQAVKPSGGLKEHFAEKKVFVADETMQTITLKLEERTSQAFIEALRKQYASYTPAPEMVAIPAGHFRMGCSASDTQCDDDEKPVHEVNLSAFAIGKYEVNEEMWVACYAQGVCDTVPHDYGEGREKYPAHDLQWEDVQKFLAWINKKTGKSYRLPSEAEWEYAARAGTKTIYSWGDKIENNCGSCQDCDYKWLAPVDSFATNPWGLHGMYGNVWEWCSDWYDENYYKNSPIQNPNGPASGSSGHVYRGGSWINYAKDMRASSRGNFKSNSKGVHKDFLGFRLVLPSSASGK
jgi:formylglycine-generating enzyme required for sulfatase activity